MNQRDAKHPIVFPARMAEITRPLPRHRCEFVGTYSLTRCMHSAVKGTNFCTLHPEGKLS